MEEELKALKSVFRSLVVSSPSQVDVCSLMRDYRNMMGQPIPLSKFGCRDPVSFLKKYFVDCFLFQGPDSNPTLTLIVPDTLKHIDRFVQRQKPSQSAKIKGKRTSVNETVLKQSITSKNLITTTYQVQKSIEKAAPEHYDRSDRTKINTGPETTSTQYKKQSHYNNSVIYKNKSINNSQANDSNYKPHSNNFKYKTQVNDSRYQANDSKNKPQANITNYDYKSDNQSRDSISNDSMQKAHKNSEEGSISVPTSASNKENDGFSEQSHSSAYINFMKKRMPFVSVNHGERTDCRDKEDSYSGIPLSSSTSSSKRAQLEELQRELSEMILQEPDGILCTDLLRKYRQRYRRELDFARFGFTSVLSVAVTLPQCATHALADDWLLCDERAPPPRAPYAPLMAPPRSAPTATPTDPDDALPFIDFEADVFPADCMHFIDSIPGAALGGVREGDMLEVIVGEVYSPSHFWLIRLGPDHNIAMEELMDEMNAYFKHGEGRERCLALGAVRAGHYCSSCYLGDWHRSLIVKVLDSDTVKVRHVDYGTVETVRAAELRPLLRAWAALPAQAVRSRLAAAAPPAAARRWPRTAAARFLAAVTDRRLVANVVARDYEEDILEVVLIDTSTAEDVNIGEELVRARHADAHARPATGSDAAYLYPQFSALEAGDTPNYAEIQAYLRDGIALDYVEDYRRHVPAAAPPRLPPTAFVSPRPAAPPAHTVSSAAVGLSASTAPPAVTATPLVTAPPNVPAPPAVAAPSAVSAPPTVTAPPAVATPAEPVTLPASDCEVFTVLSQVDPAVAQRFMMSVIQRARQHFTSAPLNPLAPEFLATPAPAPPAWPEPPAQLDTTVNATFPVPSTPAPLTPAPPVERPASVQANNGQQKSCVSDGRSSAPPTSSVAPAPRALHPSPYSMPPYGSPHVYGPGPPYQSPVVFGPGPPFAPGWGPPARYGPPAPTYMAHGYAHVRPPPGFERFY